MPTRRTMTQWAGLLFVALPLAAPSVMAQLPEFHGVYARANGELIELSEGSSIESDLPRDVELIVFAKSIGLTTDHLRLRRLVFVRNIEYAAGDPSLTLFGRAGQTQSHRKWGRPRDVEIRIGPVAGQTEMVRVVAKVPLVPGAYTLDAGENSGSFFVDKAAVMADLESGDNCVDVLVSSVTGGALGLGSPATGGKAVPCDRAASTVQASASRTGQEPDPPTVEPPARRVRLPEDLDTIEPTERALRMVEEYSVITEMHQHFEARSVRLPVTARDAWMAMRPALLADGFQVEDESRGSAWYQASRWIKEGRERGGETLYAQVVEVDATNRVVAAKAVRFFPDKRSRRFRPASKRGSIADARRAADQTIEGFFETLRSELELQD